MKEAEYELKTLREAAANFEEWFQHGNVQQLWPREQKALAILCARMADMIEREEEEAEARANFEKVAGMRPYSEFREEVLGAPTPDALQAAEDRGWNAALAACHSAIEAVIERATAYVTDSTMRTHQIEYAPKDDYASAIAALRREPRT